MWHRQHSLPLIILVTLALALLPLSSFGKTVINEGNSRDRGVVAVAPLEMQDMKAQLEQVHQQLREQERDIEQRVLVVKEAL